MEVNPSCTEPSSITGLKTNRREYLRKMLTSLRCLSGLNRLKLPLSRCYKLMDTLEFQETPDKDGECIEARRSSLMELSPASQPSEVPRKKTLVLDLDETLVHSSFENTGKHDIALEIKGDTDRKFVYVNLRPFAREFIAATTRMFEVVIFTAATSEYANPVIDAIDMEKRIQRRLFRDYCTCWNGCFIKDLEIFNRDLKDVIIIDNSPVSYYLHPNNAIPISSWNDNRYDRELVRLLPFLKKLSTVSDVVPVLSERYPSNEMESDIARRNANYAYLLQQQTI